ncbi:MAG TPA: hypothetical protein VI997_08595, partial [Candidatus Thermoplasmatota archaeon]|nr:hypothetical protein [Candidatus Thermoplasmatota archaeon]
MRGGIALAMLALVATVPSAPFSAADAPSGVLQRHDFSEGADGWTAVSGAATAGPFGVLEVLVVDGRARSPALPTELPIRVVANVLPPASPYSGALDVVDASGVRLARFYTFAAGCYVQVASGSPVRVPGCWSTGWMRVEFELASDGYSLRLDGLAPVTGAYLAAGAPSAIEASAASLGRPIRLDVVRVDRGPRVDDGLVESAS